MLQMSYITENEAAEVQPNVCHQQICKLGDLPMSKNDAYMATNSTW